MYVCNACKQCLRQKMCVLVSLFWGVLIIFRVPSLFSGCPHYFQGVLISGCPHFRVSSLFSGCPHYFQGVLISGCPHFRVSSLFSGCPHFRVSSFQGVLIIFRVSSLFSGCQGVLISGCPHYFQGVLISGCLHFRVSSLFSGCPHYFQGVLNKDYLRDTVYTVVICFLALHPTYVRIIIICHFGVKIVIDLIILSPPDFRSGGGARALCLCVYEERKRR